MLQIFFIERETFFTLCAQYVGQTFMSEVGCYQPADKYIIKKMNIIDYYLSINLVQFELVIEFTENALPPYWCWHWDI